VNTDLLAMMTRIQALINKADDAAATPEEAATYRAKAEELLRKYRLQEEDLIAQDPASAEPVCHSFLLYSYSSRVGAGYRDLISLIAWHNGCSMITSNYDEGVWANLVGYEGDLRATELMYTNAVLVFQERIDPRVDPSMSDEDNCYRLRSAGMLRREVAEAVFGENTTALRSRVQRLYVAACAKRNEAPAVEGTVNAKDYRRAYADGFNNTLRRALWVARDAADSVGGAIVLHGRAERVQEAVYSFFPRLRPSTEPVVVEDVKSIKEYKPTKRDEQRAYRRFYSRTARAGNAAGRSAAADVQLDRAPRARRIEEN
jgi:hypothetical protein